MNQSPLRKSSWPWLQSWQKLFIQLLPGFLVALGGGGGTNNADY